MTSGEPEQPARPIGGTVGKFYAPVLQEWRFKPLGMSVFTFGPGTSVEDYMAEDAIAKFYNRRFGKQQRQV